ncbi:MAG: DNA recombination/repair protein RecA [Prevotella sp.]|nr:DNA recombination/repair protein RecA [Bacteroides sp.]MCM1366231.1 DNA recombination/repair protein RecA [Prevotella sp.]MCM1436364.1 DNA recombination/repair protein RecA [Prevotella sp.]
MDYSHRLPYGPKDDEIRRWNRHGVDSGFLPFGILSLDEALNGGGLPRAAISELFGPPMSGKTSLALRLVVTTQAMGGKVLWVDAEHCFDTKFARSKGVILSDLLLVTPDDGSICLNIISEILPSDSIDLIVIDSLTALHFNSTDNKSHFQLSHEWIWQILSKIKETMTGVLIISQMRSNINVSSERLVSASGNISPFCNCCIELEKSCGELCARLHPASQKIILPPWV